MVKSIIGGAAAAALLSAMASAAPAPGTPARMAVSPWVVTPGDNGCRTTLELTSRSGAMSPVTLTSDGQLISLRFVKEDLPARAFLPIRIDRARFSNLMIRGADGTGELVLSEETLSALRKGAILDIVWLAEEPLSAPLAGSEQGIVDLRVCGGQTASRHREQTAAERAARERAEAEERARSLNEAQLAAVRAQAAAAEAQRRQVEETAERQRRAEAAAQERAYGESRDLAYEDERREAYERDRAYAQQRAYEQQRRRVYEQELEYERWSQPRPVWPGPRY